jgi:hypothetical protein
MVITLPTGLYLLSNGEIESEVVVNSVSAKVKRSALEIFSKGVNEKEKKITEDENGYFQRNKRKNRPKEF